MVKKYYLFLLLISFLLIPKSVYAADYCETFKSRHNNGVFSLNAVSPVYIDEEAREEYIRHLDSQMDLGDLRFDFHDVLMSSFNENFTTYNVYIDELGDIDLYSGEEDESVRCSLTLNWKNYDADKGNSVKSFINSIPTVVYPDLYIRNYYRDNVEYTTMMAGTSQIAGTFWYTSYPNITPYVTDHVKVKRNFYIDACGHFYYAPYEMGRGNERFCSNSSIVYVYYDDVVYGAMKDPKFYLYEVLYIPMYTKETKEDYISALSERLNTVLGEGTISECEYCNTRTGNEDYDNQTYGYFKSMIEVGLQNNFIDSSLNEDFDPFVVSVDYENLNGYFLVAKGTKEQVLANTNSQYQDIYDVLERSNPPTPEEETPVTVDEGPVKEEIVEKIPDTGLTTSKIIVLIGIVMLVFGIYIINRIKKRDL